MDYVFMVQRFCYLWYISAFPAQPGLPFVSEPQHSALQDHKMLLHSLFALHGAANAKLCLVLGNSSTSLYVPVRVPQGFPDFSETFPTLGTPPSSFLKKTSRKRQCFFLLWECGSHGSQRCNLDLMYSQQQSSQSSMEMEDRKTCWEDQQSDQSPNRFSQKTHLVL